MSRADHDIPSDLVRRECYPPPVPAAVELVTTHISWVFLAGDHVWKVKRPVALGFLDFSTAEQRRFFCDEELRLNRRLAPEVYEAVVPVRRGRDGHTFLGTGPVVDHAVRMRRLPAARSACGLLSAGRLTTAQLARLAARLARFYPEVADALEAARQLPRTVEENIEQLRGLGPGLLDADRLERVAARQRRDLAAHAALLDTRRAAGKAKEGHGDLRLEHVYFLGEDDAPVVIDCVEFNRALRCGDVALDVCFLAMELEAAGRADLAAYFLHRFARETNDYDFYPLVDFFVAYRALVRAKIAGLIATDARTPANKAQRKRDEARRLLALAERRGEGHPRDRAALIAVGGVVAAGKSTLAEELALRLEAPAISSDLTRKGLAGVPATGPGEATALYTEAWNRRTYDELLRRADCVLRSGRAVIVDATFRTSALRAQARALAVARGVPFRFVEVTCDAETLRERLRARRAGPTESDADEAVLERSLREYQSADELPAGERIVARSRQQLGRLAEEVIGRLNLERAARSAKT